MSEHEDIRMELRVDDTEIGKDVVCHIQIVNDSSRKIVAGRLCAKPNKYFHKAWVPTTDIPAHEDRWFRITVPAQAGVSAEQLSQATTFVLNTEGQNRLTQSFFIGMNRFLAGLKHYVPAEGEERINILIIGPPGVGKSSMIQTFCTLISPGDEVVKGMVKVTSGAKHASTRLQAVDLSSKEFPLPVRIWDVWGMNDSSFPAKTLKLLVEGQMPDGWTMDQQKAVFKCGQQKAREHAVADENAEDEEDLSEGDEKQEEEEDDELYDNVPINGDEVQRLATAGKDSKKNRMHAVLVCIPAATMSFEHELDMIKRQLTLLEVIQPLFLIGHLDTALKAPAGKSVVGPALPKPPVLGGQREDDDSKGVLEEQITLARETKKCLALFEERVNHWAELLGAPPNSILPMLPYMKHKRRAFHIDKNTYMILNSTLQNATNYIKRGFKHKERAPAPVDPNIDISGVLAAMAPRRGQHVKSKPSVKPSGNKGGKKSDSSKRKANPTIPINSSGPSSSSSSSSTASPAASTLPSPAEAKSLPVESSGNTNVGLLPLGLQALLTSLLPSFNASSVNPMAAASPPSAPPSMMESLLAEVARLKLQVQQQQLPSFQPPPPLTESSPSKPQASPAVVNRLSTQSPSTLSPEPRGNSRTLDLDTVAGAEESGMEGAVVEAATRPLNTAASGDISDAAAMSDSSSTCGSQTNSETDDGLALMLGGTSASRAVSPHPPKVTETKKCIQCKDKEPNAVVIHVNDGRMCHGLCMSCAKLRLKYKFTCTVCSKPLDMVEPVD